MDTNGLYLNIDQFDEKNMCYIKPIHFYKVTKSMGIYYKKPTLKTSDDKEENGSVKQKIIIKTPKMIVPFVPKEFESTTGKKSYRMSLSFSTLTNLYNDEDIKKFFLFIKKIDAENEDIIDSNRNKWNLPPKLFYRKCIQNLGDDFPCHLNINLPHDATYGFLFDIYDENAQKTTLESIKKRSIVSAVLELTDMWFTDKEFGANWNVLQMRKFKPYSPIQEFFMTSCFICDEDNPEDTAYEKMIEHYQKKIRVVPQNVSSKCQE